MRKPTSLVFLFLFLLQIFEIWALATQPQNIAGRQTQNPINNKPGNRPNIPSRTQSPVNSPQGAPSRTVTKKVEPRGFPFPQKRLEQPFEDPFPIQQIYEKKDFLEHGYNIKGWSKYFFNFDIENQFGKCLLLDCESSSQVPIFQEQNADLIQQFDFVVSVFSLTDDIQLNLDQNQFILNRQLQRNLTRVQKTLSFINHIKCAHYFQARCDSDLRINGEVFSQIFPTIASTPKYYFGHQFNLEQSNYMWMSSLFFGFPVAMVQSLNKISILDESSFLSNHKEGPAIELGAILSALAPAFIDARDLYWGENFQRAYSEGCEWLVKDGSFKNASNTQSCLPIQSSKEWSL